MGFLTCLYFFNISCTPSKQDSAKLVITIVVDQMRPDLLTRYETLYSGGLKWLINHGVFYSNAHHEWNMTECSYCYNSIASECAEYVNNHDFCSEDCAEEWQRDR